MIVIRKKLLTRLLVIIITSTIAPLIIAGTYIIKKSTRDQIASVRDKLTARTLILTDLIKKELIAPSGQLAASLVYAGRDSMSAITQTFMEAHPAFDKLVAGSTLIQPESPALNLYGGDLTLVETTRDLLAASGSRDDFQIASGEDAGGTDQGPFIFKGLGNEKTFVISLESGAFSSLLQGFARAQKWENRFALVNTRQQTTYFYEGSRGGFHFDGAFDNEANEPFQVREYQDGQGTQLFSLHYDLPELAGLTIISEIPRSLALSSIVNIWYNLGIFLVVGVLLALLGTVYYWKKITRPLDRFARGATEIARGDFSQKIQVDSDDEIGRLARIFNYMTIELRRLHEMNLNKIITEKSKTQTIIKNIADGVIVTDNFDRVVALNVAIEDWFEKKESEVFEKPISMLIHVPGLFELLENVRDLEHDPTYTKELSFQLPGHKKESIFQAKSTRLLNQEKKFIGVVTILRDITREKEIDRMKTELVSLVAHELRSPLATISGFAEILGSLGETSQQTQEYANIIKGEAERLADLVNKYLDLTKIEAGRMDFQQITLPVKQVFDSMLYLATSEAQKKNIEVLVNVDEDDCTIFADEKMISEVFINLLTNAIKYSPADSKVSVNVAENSHAVNIFFQDQGYGIAEYHIPHLFDKFYRIKDDPRIQEERGTGLGLSLVKEIIELHGGTISVESQVDRGTTFKVSLPKKRTMSKWKQ